MLNLYQPGGGAALQSVDASLKIENPRAMWEGSIGGKNFWKVGILGKRGTFINTTEFHDVLEFDNIKDFPVPTGAESWEVVSDSAQDAVGGGGVNSVRIAYLDSSWLMTETTVNLNGTSPVAVPAMAGARAIQWMHSNTLGINRVAGGNITLRVAGTGTIHERITAGGNQSLSCRFTVPGNCFATVGGPGKDWAVACTTNHIQDFRLRGTCTRFTRELLPGVYLFQDIAGIDNSTHSHATEMMLYPPMCQIKISTITSNTSAKITASFFVRWEEI